MMTMRGPTARLESIGYKIGASGHDLLARVSRAAESEVMPLIQQGYNTRTDPYGRPWPFPIAGNKPMERNRKLRTSYEVIRTISAARWTVYAINKARAKSGGAYYGAILQHGFMHRGGKYVEPRKQVPDKEQHAQRWESRIYAAGKREGQTWAREFSR
jgi:hypothetical protein